MNIKFLIEIILIFMLFSNVFSSIPVDSQKDQNTIIKPMDNIIYVDDDNVFGPWDGTRLYPFYFIQDAINYANSDQTIYIFEGTYNQTVNIKKRITLVGQDKNSTIIDGMYQPLIIQIHHQGVKISNLTMQKSGGYKGNTGILINASNVSIIDCKFFTTRTAIKSDRQTSITIKDCIFNKNGEGIFFHQNQNCIIDNCIFYQNGFGVHLNRSKIINLMGLKAHTNGIGVFIKNSSYIDFTKCAAYNNNDNQGGFFMESCSKVDFHDCVISHNGFGIKTSHSNNITIHHSTISYNTHAGILNTDQSRNILVDQCEITKNLRISIYTTHANITCTRNNIYNSLCGLYSEESLCNVQQNWWGSWFGPGLIEREQQDNIKQLESIVDYMPWEKEKKSDVGASWKINDLFNKPVSFIEVQRNFSFIESDTDGDGVPDWWENQYGYDPIIQENHDLLDPDMDGLNNIEECYTASYGSNPFHRDIFLEIDWMECRTRPNETNKPSDEYIKKAVDIFAVHNISIHIDVGNLDGGEEIPYEKNFSFADLKDFYWDYFLHQDITNPRKGIFHYGLICDYGPASGFAVIGWDNLDSFCICAQTLQDNHEIPYPRQRFIIGSSIHELGHNLGLTVDDHGGNDNKISTLPGTIQWLKYLTYPSCMNYFFTYFILGFSDGSHGLGDFDDWGQMDLSFFKNTHFVIPDQYR